MLLLSNSLVVACCLQIRLLKVSDLIFKACLDKSYGMLAGLPAIILKESVLEKSSHLATNNLAFDRVANDTQDSSHMIIDNPDDKFATYKILLHIMKVAHPPGWQGLLFLEQIPAKHLKARKDGAKHLGWTELVPETSQNDADGSGFKCAGRLGVNWPLRNARQLAIRCKFDNAEKVTFRTGRRTGISNVANCGVPQKSSNSFARHKSSEVNVLYQDVSKENHVRTVTANWYRPPEKSDEADKENTKNGT